MKLRSNQLRVPISMLGVAAGLSLLSPHIASAHQIFTTGAYRIAIGWQFEPAGGSNTYVGVINAIQVFIDQPTPSNAVGTPVSGLNADCTKPDFQVTVKVGSTTSSPFCPTSVYDVDTARGRADEYDSPISPEVPGDYTFHIYGTINGTAIDQTITSGPTTFDSLADSSSIDFPTTVPPLSAVATKVDQVDQRTSSAQSMANVATILAVIAVLVAVAVSFVSRTKMRKGA